MYARVSKVMAQFVLKIEKLSHIMGPTPILEMARAYGLRPRSWLLLKYNCNRPLRRECGIARMNGLYHAGNATAHASYMLLSTTWKST